MRKVYKCILEFKSSYDKDQDKSSVQWISVERRNELAFYIWKYIECISYIVDTDCSLH